MVNVVLCRDLPKILLTANVYLKTVYLMTVLITLIPDQPAERAATPAHSRYAGKMSL